MDGATYSYAPGRALAVCGPRVAALVDLPPDAGLVPGLYELVSSPDGNLDEVLELLVTPGLRAGQQFALAERSDEGLRGLGRLIVAWQFTGEVRPGGEHVRPVDRLRRKRDLDGGLVGGDAKVGAGPGRTLVAAA